MLMQLYRYRYRFVIQVHEMIDDLRDLQRKTGLERDAFKESLKQMAEDTDDDVLMAIAMKWTYGEVRKINN